MSDSDVSVSFGADTSGLAAGLASASAGFADCMSGMRAQMAPLSSAWEKALSGMLARSTNFHKARQTLELGAVKTAAEAGTKLLENFAVLEAKKVALAASSQAQLLTVQQAGSAQSLAANADSALKFVANDAAQAFAGATAFLAPVLGPAAPAGAAAVSAAVLAEGANVMSASGGYDIPAGINPLTQLHQSEMVLPADLADKVRNMSGGASGMTVHIHAMDSLSMKSFLDRNGQYLVDSLNRQARQFNYGR
jgi:hypothetical protein